MSKEPPSPPSVTDPTDKIIDPELPEDEEEPVLIATKPLSPSELAPVPRDIEPLNPLALLSITTEPEPN